MESNAVSLSGTDFSADTWPVQAPDYLCSLTWLPASSVFSAESHALNGKPYLAWQRLLSCKELAFVKELPHFLLSKSLAIWKNSSCMDFRFAELVKSLGWAHKWWGVSGYKYKYSLRKNNETWILCKWLINLRSLFSQRLWFLCHSNWDNYPLRNSIGTTWDKRLRCRRLSGFGWRGEGSDWAESSTYKFRCVSIPTVQGCTSLASIQYNPWQLTDESRSRGNKSGTKKGRRTKEN